MPTYTTYGDAIAVLERGIVEEERDATLPGVIGDNAREIVAWLTKAADYLRICRTDAQTLAELNERGKA
jgi:hypothetical protein